MSDQSPILEPLRALLSGAPSYLDFLFRALPAPELVPVIGSMWVSRSEIQPGDDEVFTPSQIIFPIHVWTIEHTEDVWVAAETCPEHEAFCLPLVSFLENYTQVGKLGR